MKICVDPGCWCRAHAAGLMMSAPRTLPTLQESLIARRAMAIFDSITETWDRSDWDSVDIETVVAVEEMRRIAAGE